MQRLWAGAVVSLVAAAGLAAASFSGPETCGQATAGCAQETETVTLNVMFGGKDIVDTAVGAGSFSTLVAAVQAAGLVDALKGDGPFTVFAPTDAAFAKLPKGTVENLLKPENKALLVSVLLYHVVPGTVDSSGVAGSNGAMTLGGQRIDFATSGGSVKVDNAKVEMADVGASNGVIHAIDTVLMPSSQDVVELAESTGMFNTLLAAAQAAGLVEALKGDGPITVFAPTDEAFAKLPKGTVENLLKPENRDSLAAVLTYHVVAGRVYAKDAVGAERAETLQGGSVSIRIKDGNLMIDGARVIKSDIEASNGVVHVVDSVLLPG